MMAGVTPDADSEKAADVLLVGEKLEGAWRSPMQKHGVLARSVPSAGAAWSILGEEQVALVVMALLLPDGDGRELLRELKGKTSTAGIPVVVVTPASPESLRGDLLSLGATGIAERPVAPETVRHWALRVASEGWRGRGGARTDGLTGLLSRAGLREVFERDHLLPGRTVAAQGVAVFDVRDLDGINQQYDRTAGDRVLREVARRLERGLPGGTPLARPGSDEIVALLYSEEKEEQREDVARAVVRVESEPIGLPDGTSVEIGLTAGLSTVEIDDSFDEEMTEAEGASDEARPVGDMLRRLEEEAQPTGTARVLLAEDDAVTARLVTHRLGREGYEVVHRERGKEALEAARETKFDLALLDVNMPGMNGFQVLQHLREGGAPELPVIILTSMGRDEDLTRGFELGAQDYVVKPFSPVELMARVRRLLHR